MKRKNKQRYIDKINKLRDYGNGWPLELLIADRRQPYYNKEYRYYKQWDNYSRTKKGRIDGSYEINFGHPPSRISHGN